MKVYVASSWRNTSSLDQIINMLRQEGHDVYDFRAGDYFAWEECDHSWNRDTASQTPPRRIIRLLTSRPADRGFRRDMTELENADAVVLAMPCGRSAHLELGWAIGAGKITVVYLSEPCEPELMWNAAHLVTDSIDQIRLVVR